MDAHITSAKGKTVYFISRGVDRFEKVTCENGKRKLSGTEVCKTVYGAKFQSRISAVIAEVEQAVKQ